MSAPGFGDAERDRADVGHDRDLDGDFGARVGRVQFFDDLRQVFDRVDVVVVRRRDQVHAGRRVPRGGDFDRDFLAGQVAALAGLGALADLDLQEVAGVQHVNVDAEPARRDLLAPIVAITCRTCP